MNMLYNMQDTIFLTYITHQYVVHFERVKKSYKENPTNQINEYLLWYTHLVLKAS